MTGPRIVATALAVVLLTVVSVAGFVAVWLTDELRVFPLVLLPAVVSSFLVLSYSEWGRTPKRPMRSTESKDLHETA